MSVTLRVQCYSERERDNCDPVRFELSGQEYFIEELVDRWRGSSHTYFKVRADDGNLYILSREESREGQWRLESFRRVRADRGQ